MAGLCGLYRVAFQTALGWCHTPLPRVPCVRLATITPFSLSARAVERNTPTAFHALPLHSAFLQGFCSAGDYSNQWRGAVGKSHGKKGDKTRKYKSDLLLHIKEHHKNVLTEQLHSRVFPCLRHMESLSATTSAHQVLTQLWCCNTAKAVLACEGTSLQGPEHCWHLAPGCCTSFIQQDICNLAIPRFSAMMSFEWKHSVKKNCWFTPFENTELYKFFFYMEKISFQRGKSCSPVLQCQQEFGISPLNPWAAARTEECLERVLPFPCLFIEVEMLCQNPHI